jgi:UDP-4-amino-4,6-dideoxy-N-acetyl-beta-L-altrosamine transaminase
MEGIPYSRQNITDEDIAAVVAVLRSSHLTQGPAIERFEADFAACHEVPHAIAMSNATAALHLGCLGLGAGPGHRVWTSPISFVASANCALYCGASVDFVDIDPTTRLMSVEALSEKLQAAERDGSLPTVVIPVDLTGLPCDYAAIRALADRYGFKILADASHAVGASYRGRPAGAEYVDAAVFSFHAVKIVTTGEGGMLTTRDDALAERIRLLRTHGITRDSVRMERQPPGEYYYEQRELGFNYRMTDIQAALGSAQLARLAEMAAMRRARADRYDDLLAGNRWILPVRLPDRQSAWHLYVVEQADTDATARDRLFGAMRAAGIGVNLHYLPIHLQPYYRALGFTPGSFPAAERYAARAITLPLFPAMTDAQQDRVVAALAADPQ